ncbi:beta-fructofuranosidase, insoluble isoenzyme CWINV3 [Brassica napus]|uniref:beta-fructofuranosidase, insoluble isoenzyme CWINV3 n=1 Tax=Brassica napus TaxID=3708 RepID=UPI0006AB679C|nr:beta-fructofuranosidase, insoluble isoenzyme CWINV3 [Brassica napus]
MGKTLLLLSLLLCSFIIDLEASRQDLNQPYRTGYHFQPPSNWMNDPNGPMVYKGIYHLFYQYNPYGAVWDVRIVWGHSTSLDLVNWTPQPPAFSPSQPSDINGCWSGSVTILPNGTPVILYTGIDQNKSQVQNVAVPVNISDPYLREWSKSPANPLMAPNAVNGINPDRFRDPTTAWMGHDGEWRVIVGSSTDDRRGLAVLYKSRDFFNWTQATKPLHHEDLTGMWECPDFFPVSITGTDCLETSSFGEVKHVLKVSLIETLHDYYTIGSYDREKDVYVPDHGFVQDGSAPRLDYGKFYASKTFYDDVKKRRILWGWVNESSPAKDDIEKGWSGLQSFPRKIWLGESGNELLQWPIEEIETLRETQVKWDNKVLKAGSTIQVHGVTAAQADVDVSFKVKDLEKADVIEPSWTDPQKICSEEDLSVKSGLGPFGLMVLTSNDMEEYTSVYFRIFKSNDTKYVVLMCSDQSRSSLNEENDKATFGAFVAIDPSQETLSLRTLIDHSIVESYGGGGKVCITSRVYPKLAIGENTNLFVFNKGTQSVDVLGLNAWSLKSAQINGERVSPFSECEDSHSLNQY